MIARLRRDCDAGAGTVWVLLAATIVWTVGTWSVTAMAVSTTRAHARAAADLSALAAAAHAREGERAACDAAREVAEANLATVESCVSDVESRVAEVTVSVLGRGLIARERPAFAHARAGPSE